MSGRIPIPDTPEQLILIATHLDRFWAFLDAQGRVKWTLEEEFAYIEREARSQ